MTVLREMRWWDIDPVLRLERELFPEDAWSRGMFWSELAHARGPASTRRYLVAEEPAETPGESAGKSGELAGESAGKSGEPGESAGKSGEPGESAGKSGKSGESAGKSGKSEEPGGSAGKSGKSREPGEKSEEPGGGRIVGYAGLVASPGDQADVQTIAVARDQWGTGLGSRLLTELLRAATAFECAEVMLECRVDNVRAQKLYERFGFAPIGVRRGYYQPGNVDALVMRLVDPSTSVPSVPFVQGTENNG